MAPAPRKSSTSSARTADILGLHDLLERKPKALSGGTQPAPYDAPLDHYDDDIAALEAHAGREARWVLPGGKMNYFAPRSAPPVS